MPCSSESACVCSACGALRVPGTLDLALDPDLMCADTNFSLFTDAVLGVTGTCNLYPPLFLL